MLRGVNAPISSLRVAGLAAIFPDPHIRIRKSGIRGSNDSSQLQDCCDLDDRLNVDTDVNSGSVPQSFRITTARHGWQDSARAVSGES